MVLIVFRVLWRIFIFLLGVYIIYFAIFRALPYFEAKLPLAIAVLLIYCLLAYAAIPALLRLFRLVIKPNHIPMYVTTPDGWPADPVNIAIVAHSKKHFIDAMVKAGWYTADPPTLKNVIREAISVIFRTPYPNAPFSKLYLFGRPFDIGFQMPRDANKSAHARHHVRFWRLMLPEDDNHHHHYHFWHKHLKHLLGTDKEIWIGAAIDDTGPLAITWRNGQITHRNDPLTDNERDFIINTLTQSHKIKRMSDIQAGEPFKFRGQVLRNKFICDGSIRVIELKNPLFINLASKKSKRV
ncbi:MAG TPA: LssY C-terminal domain-containing protein [Candidatus Saccharimonadales bacterium]